MPVACPYGRQITVIRGHSRAGGHAADLRKRCSASLYPEPSKLGLCIKITASSSPVTRAEVMATTFLLLRPLIHDD